MNKPLVSVVIPLFNKEEYISTTLNSVIAQTYENIEVIVIDDSSTDESLNLARKLLNTQKERFVDIKVVTRPNSGQAAARNEGINLANGQFVAFLDADDVWHPEKIAKQLGMLLATPNLDLVFCNYMILYPRLYSTKAVRFIPIESKITSWLLTTGFGGALESTVVIRKAALNSNQGFDNHLQMSGGLDLAFRLTRNQKAGCVDDYLCGYRIVPSGWHNQKTDLMDSYEKLMKNVVLYGEYEKRLRLNLRIHLSLWYLRTSKSIQDLKILVAVCREIPFSFLRYLLSTLWRIFISQIRGFLHLSRAKLLREIADL
jgi:glycosyltransferase involved in cell wall biosynthesis